jgi:hypothetical protein
MYIHTSIHTKSIFSARDTVGLARKPAKAGCLARVAVKACSSVSTFSKDFACV